MQLFGPIGIANIFDVGLDELPKRLAWRTQAFFRNVENDIDRFIPDRGARDPSTAQSRMTFKVSRIPGAPSGIDARAWAGRA